MVTTWARYSSVLAASAAALLLASASAGARQGTASPYATQIAAMRQARTLLETADHDYNGHRHNAVKLVSAAIHALQPPSTNTTHAKGTATKAASGTAKAQAATKGGNMTQAASDAQLKVAMGQIVVIQAQLSKATGTAPAAAVAELQKAVQELQTALSIK
jgi:hypothetical protein